MKCEQPGYTTKNIPEVDLAAIALCANTYVLPAPDEKFTGLKFFPPRKLPLNIGYAIEDFLFPAYKFSSEINRRMEIQTSRKYLPWSTVFVYFLNGKIVGTWRIISKLSTDEEMPIESARIVQILDPHFAPFLQVGDMFLSSNLPQSMPGCEIGGLRILGFSSRESIDKKIIIDEFKCLEQSCYTEAKTNGYRVAFLTCKGTPDLVNLYKKRYGFHEFADVSYGGGMVWKALVKQV